MPVSCSQGASNFDISDLEKKHAINFPDDYKRFLSTYNGFAVETPDFCELSCDSVDDGLIAFYSLFGLKVSNKYNDLEYQNEEYLNELDFIEHSFIIGDDPGGNYFVLVCNKSQKGIYYWDRTHLHIEDEIQDFSISEINESGNLYKIHNEFSEFMTALTKKTLDKGMKLNKDL